MNSLLSEDKILEVRMYKSTGMARGAKAVFMHHEYLLFCLLSNVKLCAKYR